tara:strand:- start:216 stop:467 length:252 start_codon:yes stop_codon:yes gene_type:complete
MSLERTLLKQAWFNMDHSNTPVRKQIIVEMTKGPHWPGYGEVQILTDGPDSYSSFKTHQENPIEYAKSRKEYISGEYELVIKD